MKCTRCQHENRLGAKFCEECATLLARACVNCGTQLSPIHEWNLTLWRRAGPSLRDRDAPLVAHGHLGLGLLHSRTDKRQEAREHLTIATTMYREMDMGFWQKAETAMASWREGHPHGTGALAEEFAGCRARSAA